MENQDQNQNQNQDPPTGPFSGYIADPVTGAFKEGWADSLPDDLKATGATLKNYANFGEMAKALHGFATATPGVTVPSKDATPEQVKAFIEAIGAGEKPESYGLPETDKALAEWAAKNRIPKTAVNALLDQRKTQAEASAKAQAAADEKAKADLHDALLKQWKTPDAVKSNTAQALSAARALGINLDEYPYPEVAFAFAKIGEWFKNEDFRQSKGIPDSAFSLMAPNPRSQADDIITNPRNPDYEKYHQGDPAMLRKVRELYERGG